MNKLKPITIIFLLLILLTAFWLRSPMLTAGMPFFYEEDEGHHFNRVVDMVKSGKFDPEYFHKPSLHFYLRMPFVAAGFLWSVRKGEIRSLKEIKTHDQYGLADYNFTASHPKIVVWVRSVTLLLSLATVFLTFLIARKLTRSEILGLGAALIVAATPALIIDSAKIGVDTLLVFMSLFSTYLALKTFERLSIKSLALLGLVCGLTVSSKYNALPIVFLPIAILVLQKRFSNIYLLVAFIFPGLGFLLGSPFILSSIPLFLDQLAYEIWHYGIAGHLEHTAEPGWPQVKFYFNWLTSSALGWAITGLALVGSAIILLRRRGSEIILLIFPVLFSLLMIGQRANFTRNMLPILPFLIIIVCIFIRALSENMRRSPHGLHLVLLTLVLIQPFSWSLSLRSETLSLPIDSRILTNEWLAKQNIQSQDIAYQGELLLPKANSNSFKLIPVSTDNLDQAKLWLAGFDKLVFWIHEPIQANTLDVVFGTASENQRIVNDPKIGILTLKPPTISNQELSTRYPEIIIKPKVTLPDGTISETNPWGCYSNQDPNDSWRNDSNCWVTNRIAKLDLASDKISRFIDFSGSINMEVTLMTPWTKQQVQFIASDWQSTDLAQTMQPGVESTINLQIPFKALKDGLYLKIASIHSPAHYGLGNDSRRLGLAIKSIKLLKKNTATEGVSFFPTKPVEISQ